MSGALDRRLFPWTPEIEADLKVRWLEKGESATEIARVYGGGLTRNAVLGKANRLFGKRPVAAETLRLAARHAGKKGAAKVWAPDGAATKARDERRAHLMINPGRARERAPEEPELTPLREPVITHEPKPLLQARGLAGEPGSDCRWIVRGEGIEAMVCGARAVKVYCPVHTAVAYCSAEPGRSR